MKTTIMTEKQRAKAQTLIMERKLTWGEIYRRVFKQRVLWTDATLLRKRFNRFMRMDGAKFVLYYKSRSKKRRQEMKKRKQQLRRKIVVRGAHIKPIDVSPASKADWLYEVDIGKREKGGK